MQVSPSVLQEGCKRFGTDPSATHPRPGEETANYYTELGDRPVMLRFTPIRAVDPAAETRSVARCEFMAYLAERGARVAAPVKSAVGNLVELIDEPTLRTRWALVVVEWIEGGPLDPSRLGQYASTVIRAWGAVMGRMHSLTKEFPRRDGLLGWDEESAHFMNRCKRPAVADKWRELRSYLTTLPTDAECYGLVHNDLHSMNVIAYEDTVTAIDFDDACYHWFACDIAIAMQAVLWTTTNGVESNMPRWRQVYRAFMNGYREENDLDPKWEEEIPTFLAYRRLLLYSVFENVWTRPGAWQRNRLAVWREGILSDTPVIGPVNYSAS